MDWLRRIGIHSEPDAPVADERIPDAVEGATPGVGALLEGLSGDLRHSVLDLGPAVPSHLAIYRQFARRMRFADLLGASSSASWTHALEALPPQPGAPYDVVFAWDILDRLSPESRPRLLERLAELTGPGARIHVLVQASEGSATSPLSFTLLDPNRMRYQATGPPRTARPRIQPAEVERLLTPFVVTHAFTLKVGLREYVGARPRS